MNRAARILVVEDEAIVAFNLQQRLMRLGYEVPAIAASCDEAMTQAEVASPDLVLMDIRIQGESDGIDTAGRLNAVRPTPVVYLTAYSEDSTLERARATKPYGYLLKPFSERELHATIQMALARRDTERELSFSEERLRLAIDAAGLGVWDRDDRTCDVNLQGQAATILRLGEQIAHVPWQTLLAHVDPDDQARVEGALEQAYRSVDRAVVEFRVAGAGVESGWTRLLAKQVDGGQSGQRRVIGVVQDVSEQKVAWHRIEALNRELEAKVEARTRALQESMADLDAFNYSVAHDLRAPVRAVISFTSMIIEDYGDGMPPEGRQALERVIRAGQRMGELIEALLSLARITRAPLTRDAVDLSAMVADIVANLRDEAPGRAVDVVIQPGVVGRADLHLIRIVLENLLRNAWKFTSRHPTARIEFGTREVDGVTEYYVRDDGAGFTTDAAANLFGVFQRLHTAAEFDGVGIGLVTVQRIVQRHGGRVRGEGEHEKGATFSFTLG